MIAALNIVRKYKCSCDFCDKKLTITACNRYDCIDILRDKEWRVTEGQFIRCPDCIGKKQKR